MAGRAASKSPGPVRRSSRQSTPSRDAVSPPPPTRSSRLFTSASTPSLASLVPPSTSTGSGMSKSPSKRALSPRAAAHRERPALPTDKANKLMSDNSGKSLKVHKVKTQTLHLGEGAGTITIARVKCPVPKGVPGHIIKRFDTDAISASSLFRAAFPTASESEETREMHWVAVESRGNYGDTAKAGMEHVEAKKLSGTWIPASRAMILAGEYGIARYAKDLVAFTEDCPVQPDTPGTAGGNETDDSPALRSPRSKRQRVSSPLANKSSSSAVQALSGASGPGISIHQTLERTNTGTVTETTEVKIDVPVPAQADGDAVPTFDEAGEAQIEAAKKLVEDFKKEGTLADLSATTHIPEPHASSSSGAASSSKKRSLEVDEDDADLPESGTLADAIVVDNRSFLSKLFRRNQKKRKPTQASRETKALPAPRAAAAQPKPEIVVREEGEQGEGRRWAAGLGLAVAVGATAAAPYLFG
ncbi:hypothetical protein JCM8547_007342 [Rhodosporidiobolus lusitaniae]